MAIEPLPRRFGRWQAIADESAPRPHFPAAMSGQRDFELTATNPETPSISPLTDAGILGGHSGAHPWVQQLRDELRHLGSSDHRSPIQRPVD